ncbi:ATP-binding protein [Lapidilactobacillus dextrinicus]|uniref:ATP-binding protein n=1 Tax=Lapidilactobacillus dextrinicus TaxID=51664 RepID=UPI003F26C3FE
MKNEDTNIEYKSTLTNKLKREIVSFLNSNSGGKIYIGVDDKTKVPLKVSENDRHSWEETITNWSMNAFYPTPYSLIDVLPNEDVFTVIVKPGRNKPYAIATNGFDSSGVYVRTGSSAAKATNEQVKRMQQQYEVSGEFDSEFSNEQNLTFNAAKVIFSQLDINFDENSLRLMQNSKYNNSALLISDQDPYITKLAVYDGINVNKFDDKREFTGSIATQIDSVLSYLDLINRNSINITGRAQRDEQRDFPSVALREAIVNAFVHRDYLLHSDVKIEVFNDRIEIVSPGGIPDGLTLDEIKDGMTAARNPRLIHILNKMKYIENYGTGIRRIIASYESSPLKPAFEVRNNSFKVILLNRNYNSNVGKLNLEKESVNQRLTVNEQKIIKVLSEQSKPVKRAELQELSGLNRSQILVSLKSLREQELVRMTGASVNAKYLLNN